MPNPDLERAKFIGSFLGDKEMRFAMGIGCALLLSVSGAHAFDLDGMKGATNNALLEKVNKNLAEQQKKDGQFEFKPGKAEFAPGNEKRVKGLLKVINDNSSTLKKAFPKLKVVSEGHTDSDGKAEANMKLSQARAEKVCSELKAKGMVLPCGATGVGASVPLVSPEKTKSDKQRNRRVLVQVAN
jgi:outer membrane protein OmpA-like peptidoglycan-associated protein